MLKRWMRRVLRFAGVFNLCAGGVMVFAPHLTYMSMGMEPPKIDFPMQLVGVLVALFGAGYHFVASRPAENRNVLLLGLLSKTLGSVLATWYVVRGDLPLRFVAVYLLADVIYLPPFYVILRRIDQVAAERAASTQQ